MRTLLDCLRAGDPPPFPVTDLHGHLGRYAFAIPDQTVQGLLRVMDRTGVQRIVCSHMQCMSADTHWGNAQVHACMRQAPGRILGYVSVFPASAAAVKAAVQPWLDAGFSGLKMHDSNGFRYDDPAYLPAYEMAHERALPVLLHTWGVPAQFDAAVTIARCFPDLTVILAHGGSADAEGYVQAVKAAPNLVMDTCFSRCPFGLVERLVNAAGPERVVFGSDCTFYSLTQQLGKIMATDLPDAVKRQILSDNAERILGPVRPDRPQTPGPGADQESR